MTKEPGTGRQIVIAATPWDSPAATALRDAQQQELRAMYGGDTEPGVKPTSSDVAVFLMATDVSADQPVGTPVACGGLRPLGATTAEIKRMYVEPSHRGEGLSRAVLEALEEQALDRGWTTLVLETGLRQEAAISLYLSAGYVRIAAFGAYTGSGSLCFGKTLG